jgi:hypothetical protein
MLLLTFQEGRLYWHYERAHIAGYRGERHAEDHTGTAREAASRRAFGRFLTAGFKKRDFFA